jgi:hypothetical protein
MNYHERKRPLCLDHYIFVTYENEICRSKAFYSYEYLLLLETSISECEKGIHYINFALLLVPIAGRVSTLEQSMTFILYNLTPHKKRRF